MQAAPKRPRIAFDIDPSDHKDLVAAATQAGIPPNTLSRALFRWAMPLFQSENFSVANLKQRYGDGQELVERLDPNTKSRPRPAKPKAG